MVPVPPVRRIILVAPARAARVLGVARFALLALASVGVAHDAVFAAEHGVGAGFAAAMSAGGHDSYWPAFSVGVVLAMTLLSGWAFVRLGRAIASRSRAGGGRADDWPAGRREADAPRSYRQELRRLWLPLLGLTAAAFAMQENAEHLAGHGHLIGIGALAGPEYPLALPVIALVTFVVAAIGALVRWRIAVLDARRGARIHLVRPRGLAAHRPGPGWAHIAALRLRALFLVRPDAGRAPPRPV